MSHLLGFKRVARAFVDGRTARLKNDATDGQSLLFHGNRIAWRAPDGSILVTLAGWSTVTTRGRLNALCRMLDSSLSFYQSNHAQFVTVAGSTFETDAREAWEAKPAPSIALLLAA